MQFYCVDGLYKIEAKLKNQPDFIWLIKIVFNMKFCEKCKQDYWQKNVWQLLYLQSCLSFHKSACHSNWALTATEDQIHCIS